MPIKEVSEEELESYVKEHEIVLVDFTATWCGPCKMMAKILHEVDDEISIDVAKVDIDANPNISNALQVTAVPTLMFFYKGKRLIFQQDDGQMDRFMGVQPKELILQVVEHLRNNPNATEEIPDE